MSQITKLFDGTILPDIETLTADIGGAVSPDAAFNINIIGGTGIDTSGNPLTNTITISQEGKLQGTGQTIGAVTADLITVNLGAVAGVYTFDIKVVGFDAVTPQGLGYTLVGSVRTTGAGAILIPGQTVDEFEEIGAVLSTCQIAVAANTAIVRVLGLAGKTINWKADLEYIFI